jgi:hypothetical protein
LDLSIARVNTKAQSHNHGPNFSFSKKKGYLKTTATIQPPHSHPALPPKKQGWRRASNIPSQQQQCTGATPQPTRSFFPAQPRLSRVSIDVLIKRRSLEDTIDTFRII